MINSPEAVFDTDEERSYFLIRLPIHKEMLVEEQDTIQDDAFISSSLSKDSKII